MRIPDKQLHYIVKMGLILQALVLTISGCATMQNYNALPPRDQAFYNLLYVSNQNVAQFAELKTQQERDAYLSGLGYLQKYNELPPHVQSAILEHEIVVGAPEFTLYMTAGRPIKENKQVSMEGEARTLFYLRCSKDSGANAGMFVSESSVCVARMSSVFKTVLLSAPESSPRDPLLAEALNYMVTVKAGKIASVLIVTELPR